MAKMSILLRMAMIVPLTAVVLVLLPVGAILLSILWPVAWIVDAIAALRYKLVPKPDDPEIFVVEQTAFGRILEKSWLEWTCHWLGTGLLAAFMASTALFGAVLSAIRSILKGIPSFKTISRNTSKLKGH